MKERLKKIHILVIDDDVLIQKLVHDVLEALGFGQVSVASDAAVALRMMRARPVDLVICDWRMPGTDGLELVQFLRSSPDSPNHFVPILMLTGNTEMEHVAMARDVGVSEYLAKPFTVKELCRRITQIVENPREFVFCDTYYGPSRRRRDGTPPDGVDRRKNPRRK